MEKVFGDKRNTQIASAVVRENSILQWITKVYCSLVVLQMKVEKMLLRPVDFLKKFEVLCGHLELMAVMRSAAKEVYRWRRDSSYYRQSVADNSIYRSKQIIGPGLRARNENSRKVEAVLGYKRLKRSRALGIPQWHKVA